MSRKGGAGVAPFVRVGRSSIAVCAMTIVGTTLAPESRARADEPPAAATPPPPATPATPVAASTNEPVPASIDTVPCPGCDTSNDFGDRTMKGHTFVFPLLQRSAFVTTYVGMRTGIASVSTDQVPIGNRTFSASQFGVRTNFDFGFKIRDWLGAYVSAEGLLLTGITVASLVTVGGDFTVGMNGGLVARITQNRRSGTQLAAHAFGGVRPGSTFTLLRLVDAIANDPKDRTAADVIAGNAGSLLLTPTRTYTVGGSLNLAQTLGRYFDLQAEVYYAYSTETQKPFDPESAQTVERVGNANQVAGALAATFDAGQLGVPAALQLEYALQQNWVGERRVSSNVTLPSETYTANFVGGGLYYTGRRELQFGVTAVTELGLQPVLGVDANLNPAPSSRPRLWFSQFIVRYVW